jgi:adenylate cyclase
MAPDGAFWVDYAPADTVPPPTPTVPYVVALAGEQSDAFRDRIVLIGATAPDLQDLYDAPARRVLARGATQERIPGVAVHANAICTLLAERPLRPAAPWLTWLSTLLLGALTGVATFAARPVRALWAYVLPATVVAGGGAFTVFAYGDLWVNLALPLSGGIGLAYVGATVLAYLTVERDRKRIEAEWAKRVSPEVLTRLLADPGLRHVEGRTIQATILFSDLRGFTTLCHSLPPTDVVRRLNEIFDRMTRVIKAHGGTIDKFIGDGIMAVFGDPIPYPDHARRAVEAAIDMLRANEELRDAATERGEEPIRMGVGMHSGEIVIGDIGSELFLEYTAIGDTVSTASRLEGLNKEYHTEIICSDDTLRLAGEGLATRPLGATTVRGRETPLQVHEVLWAKNLAQ